MHDFKTERLQNFTPGAPTFAVGARVAYRQNPGQLLYGTVIDVGREPHRYIVRIDAGRVKAIDAHNLTLV